MSSRRLLANPQGDRSSTMASRLHAFGMLRTITWQCGNVATWQRGNVAMWQRGNVATWQRGNVT